jgi:lysozyme
MMISTEQITQRLLSDEDEVLHAYPDSEGYLTLGVGRLIDERKGGGITREESRYLLRNDIARRIGECESRFEWFESLDPVRQQAIVCIAFQLGTEGLAKFKKAIAAIVIRDWITAEIELLDSKWHQQTPERCERMAKIILTGAWQ